jgi:LAS superfamily LD-carboxypeptidase LdcB
MLSPNKAKYDYLKSLVATSGDVVISTGGGGGNVTQTSLPLLTNSFLDPKNIINPTNIGIQSYGSSPVAKDLMSKKYKNGQIPLNVLTQIGPGALKTYYPDGQYRLHPTAAKKWLEWKKEMDSKKISYVVSSAYRSTTHQASLGKGSTVAAAGSSPHGWGGALDFSNLYRLVFGSGDPAINQNARINQIQYKQIAEIGAKYGWYNPWRLSDNSGTDEIWHFEYWGKI